MVNSFIFTINRENNKNIWIAFKTAMKAWGTTGKDFKVTIDKIRGNELKAYWVLISIVTNWMNEQGNHFTKEEVSDWFKMRCGHYKTIQLNQFDNSVEVPRSIALKSDCTWEEMSRLIDYILQFGAENNIKGCELKEKDREEIKELYSK